MTDALATRDAVPDVVRDAARVAERPAPSNAAADDFGLCYICDEYPPVVDAYGGMGVAFREQAEGFSRRGRRVDVICRTTDRAPGLHHENGVRVHVVRPSVVPKARAVTDRLALNALVRRICVTPADIVISAEYAGPLLVKRFSNPLVVHLEGSMTVAAVEQRAPVNRLARFFERRTVDLADAVSSVSGYAARATISALGARDRDVRVIPNSVNAATFHPAHADVDPHRVLFVGKLNRLKGLYVLADAMRRVFAEHPSATLTLVGGDFVEHGQSCLAGVLDRLQPADRGRVRALGAVGHAEVAREIRQCAVLVVPSLIDMCPTVVLEAMSSARPVVASRRGGIPELVREGRTGLLADPEQPDTFAAALLALLSEPARGDAMGAAGRQVVLATYTSDAIVDGLQRFYDELARERARGTPCAA